MDGYIYMTPVEEPEPCWSQVSVANEILNCNWLKNQFTVYSTYSIRDLACEYSPRTESWLQQQRQSRVSYTQTAGSRHGAGSGKQAVGSRLWEVGSGAGCGKQAVGSRQWAAGSGQQAVGSRKWAAGSGLQRRVRFVAERRRGE
ncbi:hypothetical protein T492DRAFT_146668 [Pavlovales sp. CCMP2436]|nr:hypothetical protein T492DRAFT_146668 [Pavlovales sp. CCMP2436]